MKISILLIFLIFVLQTSQISSNIRKANIKEEIKKLREQENR